LDDFVPDDPREPLVELADIIKVDLLRTPAHQWQALVSRYASARVAMLAKKGRNTRHFFRNPRHGIRILPGILLSEAGSVVGRVNSSLQLQYLQMLQIAYQPVITCADWKR